MFRMVSSSQLFRSSFASAFFFDGTGDGRTGDSESLFGFGDTTGCRGGVGLGWGGDVLVLAAAGGDLSGGVDATPCSFASRLRRI